MSDLPQGWVEVSLGELGAWCGGGTPSKRIDRYWTGVQPEVARCGMRQQLLLLPRYAGVELAGRVRQAWNGLSRAAHHHAYESAPTAAELRHWHNLVATVLAVLAGTPPVAHA